MHFSARCWPQDIPVAAMPFAHLHFDSEKCIVAAKNAQRWPLNSDAWGGMHISNEKCISQLGSPLHLINCLNILHQDHTETLQ